MVKIMLAVILIAFLFHLETRGTTDVCPSGWVYYDRACYLFVSDKQTWSQSLYHCAHVNGDLLAIENSGENTFIKSHLQQMYASGKNGVIYFTSGTDAANEDQWKWASTEQGFGFTDWYPGDPDGALGQNCLVLWGNANFEWIDASCTIRYNSICKIRIPVNDTAVVG